VRLLLALAAVLLAMAMPAAAQGVPQPPGPYVLDLRFVTSGVPQAAAFLPPAAADAPVPTNGVGFDAGVHVYAGRLGAARLGFGVALMNVRGSAVPVAAGTTSTPQPPSPAAVQPTGPPGIEIEVRSLTPQVSFNFGTRDGWSYLSVGGGLSEVAGKTVNLLELRRESGRVTVVNAGGGARWFVTSHIALGFDLRVHRLSQSATLPRSTLFSASGGISLR
jgi:hypothetical protein